MRSRLQHLRRDERGMSFVWVGMGFLTFFAASTLAIDVGMFMTARSQAQNAADAGALAGATALVFNSYSNRTIGGPAVQSSVSAAKFNLVVGGIPSVNPTDVTFPLGPTGLDNRVQVNVFRTTNRTNPVPTLIGSVFGVNTIDIGATATAEASPANAMTCVKPFMIPDRWKENSVPPNNTFDRYDNQGNLLMNPDEYFPPSDKANYQGYNPDAESGDIGTLLVLRAGIGNNIEPSFYFSWKMPNAIGANWYEENITGCNPDAVSIPFTMVQEPGAMAGPTNKAIDILIDKDSTAYWDGTKVVSTQNPSPRVFPIPMYDPDKYQFNQTHGRTATFVMVNWVGFFVEEQTGNDIIGRIVPLVGVIDKNAGPAPEGVFPKAIRLVQ